MKLNVRHDSRTSKDRKSMHQVEYSCCKNLAKLEDSTWLLSKVVTSDESLLYWRRKETIKQKLDSRRRKGSDNSEIRSSVSNGKTTDHRAPPIKKII